MTTTATDFFATVATFATPCVKGGKVKDPLTVAKVKFAAVCSEQIKLLKEGKEKGYCFKRYGEGAVVTLKSGATTLNPANPSFAVGSVDDAVKFFEGAKAAAAAGQFDALFTATARKPKAKKEADAGTASAAVSEAAGDAAASPTTAPTAEKKGKNK